MYDISVIIPTYNSEDLIADALDSINHQTFIGKIEIICVDDCSEDNTVEVIKGFHSKENRMIKVLQQSQNQRQGAARNRGVQEAKGEYIFFLDSDDVLDENTLEVMYKKAKLRDCDFVLCDWTYLYSDRGEVYVNNDLFLIEEWLEMEQCEKLFQAESYFTVNKLYKKDFLEKNHIRYGEGYIYEDLEFYINVVQNANMIGIVSNPFYKVRINPSSTTKTNYHTTVHMNDYLTAVSRSLTIFSPRHEESFYMVYKYLFYRAQLYSEKRIPKKYRKQMVKSTVELLNNRNKTYYIPEKIVLFNQLYFHNKLIMNNKIKTIMLVRKLQKKGKLNRYYKLYRSLKNMIDIHFYINKLKESKLNKKRRLYQLEKIKKKYQSSPVQSNTVLFLGFDYRYTGNSKYFFEYLKERYPELKINYVTKDEAVPREYRIKPKSAEFWKALGEAKVFITESWTPLAFYKKEGALWLQLWHGTPYKKLFFDSHEKFVSKYNRNHKRNKKKDVAKWDYLLSDSEGGKNKFKSAFSISSDKIINLGYPRVQWLKDNDHNQILKDEIKQKLQISNGKKVILYAPTWRDYNFKNKYPDFNYLINLRKLAAEIGNEYVVIAKLHSMEKQNLAIDNVIIPSGDIETQELLLITDCLISDFSSIIFDVLPINRNILLYINDEEKYRDARGAYEDLEKLLDPFTFKHVEDIIDQINNKESLITHPNYSKLKETYANVHAWDSNKKLADVIVNYMK
ncbi:bifunctional glycosyltransferase/CDP-glycerol:glycerophosphate glycerophosphotransferase [Heyndrickxia oleronia]|uniref:CDP-glycerol glycerophosphotransferase family protein n=1 Tax=Heyndrickxia oleronia TaxID=38875 RepID=A0AAW6ST73_9BACI|nr:CDP-glycerol glycerophosphotransferase family protein [Heyndrickxia oleronia]MDH5162026.1 CDP-glycerol glycerophosphotransferase family protein [Heyndrickxia oleronia]